MPDPIDELENFSLTGTPMNPLPAAEVRRRGNRIRRRNNALATVGGLAVVAIIAAPFALAAGGGQESDQIQPAPPVDWVTTIPADFPLSAQMPDGTEESASYEQRFTDVCEGQSWTPPAESRQALYIDPMEGGQDRTIAVYADDAAAEEAVYALASRVADCAVETDGSFPTTSALDVLDGDQAVAYVNRYTDGGDADVVRVVRVGNAVLQDSAYTLGAGNPVIVQDALDQIGIKASTTVNAMCVFSAEGCAGDQPSEAVDEPTGLSGAIPDDFPLEKGLPTSQENGAVGLEGPSHDLALDVYNVENSVQACGVGPAGRPTPVDTLYAGYRSPAEGILRQLMTFDSAEDAQAYVDGTIAPFADCPEDTDPQGVSKVYEVTQPDVGDATAVSVMRVEVDGEPGIGYQVVALTRVGQAVLFTLVNNDTQAFDASRVQMHLENTGTVVDEMG